MKKKFTTIVLALLMTMMFATAGVFAAPEDNDAEKSDYWKVEATEVTDSSAVIVWNPADDEDYEHKAVFNIYRLKDDGEKELIAENVMSKSAAAKVEVGEGEEEPLVYVYNDKEDAKDKDGKDIPLGYSYAVNDLDPDSDYELVVELTEKTDAQEASGRVEFKTKPAEETADAKETEQKDKKTVLSTANSTTYTLSDGKTYNDTPTTIVFTWRISPALTNGKVDINGYKVNPTKNSDGTYSYRCSGFDPGKTYTIPIKVVDNSGKVISNVLNIKTTTYYYQLSAGTHDNNGDTTVTLYWKMNRELADGFKVDINGYKVTPTKTAGGYYRYTCSGFDPARAYSIPVKIVDKNGKVISNVLNINVGTYYKLYAGTRDEFPRTAVLYWKMNRELADGYKVDINGYKVTPTKTAGGYYRYTCSGFTPSRSYSIPVKIVDKNGKLVSNVISIAVNSPYKLSAGKTPSVNGTTAVLNWKMSHELKDGAQVDINGYKVNPTKNSDGTYSYTCTGFQPGRIYHIPVKVVDKSGVVSNVLIIDVDTFGGQIKTMQVQFTFSETRELHSYTGGTVWTTFYAGEKYTCTGFDNGRYQFYRGGRMYYVNRLSTTNQQIVSSAFDKTFSGATATNYVNSLGISSSTNYLIWVNTYTQKMYIFYGSRGNWRLVQGPWVVSTGKPTTMTSTGLAQIRQKDYYDRNLYYWNVVSYFSIHGKVSEWVLGYPRSDGCVRNTDDHASYVYYNCPIGTAVYVY